MINRLELFINSLGISVRAFENIVGTSNGLIRKAISNKTDIQSKWISKIVENFPQLNIVWLLTGNGEMLIPSEIIPYEENDMISVISAPDAKYGSENTPEDSYIKSSDLLKALNDIAESGKLNAIANERNSRNMEKMLNLISENSSKKETSQDQNDKSDNTHGKTAAGL